MATLVAADEVLELLELLVELEDLVEEAEAEDEEDEAEEAGVPPETSLAALTPDEVLRVPTVLFM